MDSSSTFAVVTGGGTAGHVLPALSVADSLVEAGIAPQRIHYVGCQRGKEVELVPSTPYPHTFLDVVGLQRSLSRRNLAFAPKMWRSTTAAVKLLRSLQPEVVISVGGYASMPAVFAARRLGIPIVAVSFDHHPGLASRLAARFGVASAVAFEDSPLPRSTVTGAPVRSEICEVDRSSDRDRARRELGVPSDRFMLSVMGGSLGSRVLNEAIWEYLAAHRDDLDLAVRHAVGARFADEALQPLDGVDGAMYQPVDFEDRMAAVYAASDLLVGRGGASTVHEVAVTGTPAVLVPWAGAAEDHQTGNVRWLSSGGAAVLLDESDISDIGAIIDRLRDDPDERLGLGTAAFGMGASSRSGSLARLIFEVVGRSDTLRQ